MNKILQKFISYFSINSLVYYIFLIVETISLYFNEYGFDLTNGIMVSFSQVSTVISFGIFVAFILTTASLLKEQVSISKIFKFGLIISIIFGGLIFFLSNNVVPDLRMTSFLNRYENARNKAFSSQERADKMKEFKKTNADMMSIRLINHYSDSLENENISQKKIVADLFQKIPDSIIQSDFSKKELDEYDMPKSNLTTEFNHRDLYKLQTEIRKNKVLTKQLKKSNWAKNERYLNSFLIIFLVCFGIVIGVNFKSQIIFSLVCIGIVIYSETLILLTTMENYFVDNENLIGLIFKLSIIIAIFLYLVYRMQTNKNTGANNVYK